eukprot:3894970-Amphidinium_carterae.1
MNQGWIGDVLYNTTFTIGSLESRHEMIIANVSQTIQMEARSILLSPCQYRGFHQSQMQSLNAIWSLGTLFYVATARKQDVFSQVALHDIVTAEPVYFIIGFNFGMIPVEAALSRSVREELIQVWSPLQTQLCNSLLKVFLVQSVNNSCEERTTNCTMEPTVIAIGP